MDSKEETFDKYRHVAQRMAKYYTRQYCRPFHETLDHAEFALALLIFGDNSYDPNRGTYERWLHFKLYVHLKEIYLRGRHPGHLDLREFPRKRREINDDDVIKASPSKPPKSEWISRFMIEVGEEASALLEIICNAPQDVVSEIGLVMGVGPQSSRQKRLMTYLINVLDWSQEQVQTAFNEIERGLSGNHDLRRNQNAPSSTY